MRDFGPIYDEYVERVYGFFGYQLKSRADAEDLTQQTFERALRAWQDYDASRGGVGPWLFAIARNLLVDRFRAAGAAAEPIEAAPPSEISVNDRHDIGLDPDLETALALLSQRERELIALRFGADLTGVQIARLTGLSHANVNQILSRSLRRLRVTLDPLVAAPGSAAVR